MTDGTDVSAPVQRTTRNLPFGMVDTTVVRDDSLPWQVKAIYACLATYCGAERSAFPSRARLARETGMSVRSVDAAVACGRKAGLFEVHAEFSRDGQRSRDADEGERTSNRYVLRDFGSGYKAGSGPGRKLPYEWDRGAAAAPRPVQPLHPSGAAVAHEQDHLSETTTSGRSTPSGEDACAAGTRSQAHGSMPKIKLFKPKDWDGLIATDMAEEAVRYSTRAYERIGYVLTEQAKHAIGQSIIKWVDQDRVSRAKVWEQLLHDVPLMNQPGKYEGWAVPDPWAA